LRRSHSTAGPTPSLCRDDATQDLAAVLAKSTENATGLRIGAAHGDVLTLAGLNATTIPANPSVIKFL
jgi:hypothetical protein